MREYIYPAITNFLEFYLHISFNTILLSEYLLFIDKETGPAYEVMLVRAQLIWEVENREL
jgi:hypothetical protein